MSFCEPYNRKSSLFMFRLDSICILFQPLSNFTKNKFYNHLIFSNIILHLSNFFSCLQTLFVVT